MTKVTNIVTEIQAVEAEHRALLDRQQAVERALAQPGAAPDLAAELVTIGARIKAGALKLLDLGQRKQAAERAALLDTYRQRLGELYATQGEIAALDAEIQAHQDAINRLIEAKKPLETQQQLTNGRLHRLYQDGRAVGLATDLARLRSEMDKAQRAPQTR